MSFSSMGKPSGGPTGEDEVSAPSHTYRSGLGKERKAFHVSKASFNGGWYGGEKKTKEREESPCV